MKHYFDYELFKERLKHKINMIQKEKDRVSALHIMKDVVFPVLLGMPSEDVVEYDVAKRLMAQRDVAKMQLKRNGHRYSSRMEKELLPMEWKKLLWVTHGHSSIKYTITCPECSYTCEAVGYDFESVKENKKYTYCPKCKKRLDGTGEEKYRKKIETMRTEMGSD